MSTVALFMIMLLVVAGLLCLGFWIVTLIDCATKEADTGNNKVCWLLIIIFAPIVGSLIYHLVRRPQRYAELGR